jgi:hypothetical protein
MIERINEIRPLWPRIEAESPTEKGKRRKNPTYPFPNRKRHGKDKADDDEEGRSAHVDVRV